MLKIKRQLSFFKRYITQLNGFLNLQIYGQQKKKKLYLK